MSRAAFRSVCDEPTDIGWLLPGPRPRGTGRQVRLFRQVRRHDSSRPKRPAISALSAHLEPDMGIEHSARCIACLHACGGVALPSRSERSPLYHSQFSNDRTQTPHSPQPHQCRAVPRFRWGRQSVSRCTVGARAEGCRATAADGRRARGSASTAPWSATASPRGRSRRRRAGQRRAGRSADSARPSRRIAPGAARTPQRTPRRAPPGAAIRASTGVPGSALLFRSSGRAASSGQRRSI